MSRRSSRGISQEARKFITDSYYGRCQYCNRAGDTLDHIIPLSKGGARGATNMTLACDACNSDKGDELYPDSVTKPLLEAAEKRVVVMASRGIGTRTKKRKKKN